MRSGSRIQLIIKYIQNSFSTIYCLQAMVQLVVPITNSGTIYLRSPKHRLPIPLIILSPLIPYHLFMSTYYVSLSSNNKVILASPFLVWPSPLFVLWFCLFPAICAIYCYHNHYHTLPLTSIACRAYVHLFAPKLEVFRDSSVFFPTYQG